jgi:hypothetical protein
VTLYRVQCALDFLFPLEDVLAQEAQNNGEPDDILLTNVYPNGWATTNVWDHFSSALSLDHWEYLREENRIRHMWRPTEVRKVR